MKSEDILHVDVDTVFAPLLTNGIQESIPLTTANIASFAEHKHARCITFKSQSKITRDVLDHFLKLELLVARMVGTDNVDKEYCKKKGIALYYIPDYGAHNIAEHALTLILAGARFVISANQEVHTGHYSYRNYLGMSLKGKTIGIIGTGKIGLSLMSLLKPFDVTIIAYDVFKNEEASVSLGFSYVPLETVLYQSDVISVHVPLLPQTKHLIGDRQLFLVKPGAILVNTSRGGVIDTAALIKYAQKFRAIGLDVIEGEESFSATHPILSKPNVILTPHIGFYTDVSVANIADETMEIIDRFEKGDPKGRVV